MKRLSVKQLESEVNLNEHMYSYLKFLFQSLSYGLIGLLIGIIIEFSIQKLQKNTVSKIEAFGFLMLQCAMLSTIFYVALQFGRRWDDWLWSTFAGYTFSILFISSQTSLSLNVTTLIT